MCQLEILAHSLAIEDVGIYVPSHASRTKDNIQSAQNTREKDICASAILQILVPLPGECARTSS